MNQELSERLGRWYWEASGLAEKARQEFAVHKAACDELEQTARQQDRLAGDIEILLGFIPENVPPEPENA